MKNFILVFFSVFFFKNASKLQKWSVFSRKKLNHFKNTALLQLEWCLVPNSYLTLKCKIVLFETYYIYIFAATGLLWTPIWRTNGPFEILKFSENRDFWTELEMKICFLRQSSIESYREILMPLWLIHVLHLHIFHSFGSSAGSSSFSYWKKMFSILNCEQHFSKKKWLAYKRLSKISLRNRGKGHIDNVTDRYIGGRGEGQIFAKNSVT